MSVTMAVCSGELLDGSLGLAISACDVEVACRVKDDDGEEELLRSWTDSFVGARGRVELGMLKR